MEEQRPDTSGRPRPARLLLKPKLISQDQKRASERTSTQRTVKARTDAQAGAAEVPLINISPTGLQLSAGQEIDIGTILLIEVHPGQSRRATTRWCRPDGPNHLVGAEWETPLTFDEVWKIRANNSA